MAWKDRYRYIGYIIKGHFFFSRRVDLSINGCHCFACKSSSQMTVPLALDACWPRHSREETSGNGRRSVRERICNCIVAIAISQRTHSKTLDGASLLASSPTNKPMNALPGALNNGGGGGGGDAAAAPAIPVASGVAAGGSGPINSNVRDRQALTWTRMSASGSLPPPRSGAASVVVKGRLYMFGVSVCVFLKNI